MGEYRREGEEKDMVGTELYKSGASSKELYDAHADWALIRARLEQEKGEDERSNAPKKDNI